MRIIQVLHSHGYGGAENHALLLMRRFQDLGHDVLYAGPDDGWLTRQCRDFGIATEHLSMSGLYDLHSHWRLRRLVKTWRADIVHGHLVRGAFYATWACAGDQHAVPICTAHATTAYKHMAGCKHIIAVCEAVKENLTRHGHSAERISVIYNGMPDRSVVAERNQIRQELGIAESEFAVVNVGRFISDKGQDMLVRAAEQCPDNVNFYLIGDAETPFGKTVKDMAQGMSRVHFLGYRQDVQRILPAFDAYAVSSRREAFSLSIVEACAALVPCVATRVGGIPEVIRQDETGLLVPCDDAAAMAAGLCQLQSDSALKLRLALAARNLYERRFTDDRMVSDTLDVYRRAMS